MQNMLTLQQHVSRQRCQAASGYGYTYIWGWENEAYKSGVRGNDIVD